MSPQAASTSTVAPPALTEGGATELGIRLGSHIPALDAVRGLAILMVTVFRFSLGPSDSTYPGKLVFGLFYLGERGVDLFFVLSGFLITGILFDAKGQQHYFRNFYARRTLRIFPLYYGVLLAFFVVLPLLWPAGASVYHETTPHQGWLWFYGTNLLEARDEAWGLGYFNHFWSLAVEEHFYLLWPLVIFYCSRTTALRVCVGLMLVAVVSRVALAVNGQVIAAEVLTLCRLDALGVGALLALAARGPGGVRALVPWAVRGAVAFGAVLGLELLLRGSAEGALKYALWAVELSLFAAFFGAVLVLAVTAAPAGLAGRFWNARSLCFFGKYSYGMYVFQLPLLPVFQFYFPVADLAAWSGSPFLGRMLFILLALAGTVAVALVSWHLFEKQVLKFKGRFEGAKGEKQRQPRPALEVAASPAG
jgi:peptidoglycan/LPS O-acetylase OafA/YrhL